MKKKPTAILILSLLAVALLVIIGIGVNNYQKLKVFKDAEELVNAKKFDEAVEAFTALGDFRDASSKIPEIYYAQGRYLLSKKDYDGAAQAYEKAGTYKDAADKVFESQYAKAEALLKDEEFMAAANAFTQLAEFKDTKTRSKEAMYLYAQKLVAEQKNEDAIQILLSLPDYEPAVELLAELQQEEAYQKALSLFEEKNYKEASEAFSQLTGYKEADKLREESIYQLALILQASGAYEQAIAILQNIPEHSGAKTLLAQLDKQGVYAKALALLEAKNYAEAAKQFATLGEYEDAKQKASLANYQLALELGKKMQYEEALAALKLVESSPEATALKAELESKMAFAKIEALLAKEDYSNAAKAVEQLEDSEEKQAYFEKVYMVWGDALYSENKLEEAIAAWILLPELDKAKEKIAKAELEIAYQKALTLQVQEKFTEAIKAFEAVIDYKDAKIQLDQTYFLQAKSLAAVGKVREAIEILKKLPEHSEAKALLEELNKK